MKISWCSIAAILMTFAVSAGAFAAHGLKSKLEPYYLLVFEKAVFYHFVHALGILIIGAIALNGALSAEQTNRVCSIHLFGILVFSGSLYLLALTQISWLGAITPIGGTAFIIGWILLAYYLW